MPQFIFKDGRHFVSLITGPSHILLGIRFTQEAATPRLIKQTAQGSCLRGVLDESKIVEAVEEAMAVHRTAGESIFAEEIVYVEDDSPCYDLYGTAAQLLVKQYRDDADSGRVLRSPPLG